MLIVSNISIHFAGSYIFNDVSFTVNSSDKIGLIGRNGSGKSTLMKIIAGEESPENGTVSKPNDFTIGYLPQEGIVKSSKTVYDEAAAAKEELLKLDEKIKLISEKLSDRTDYESAEYQKMVQVLSEANEHYKVLGGHSLEAEIVKILRGLGFEQQDMHRKVDTFSGGWKMRIELAKILLRRPDCILLDEPTNHLDIESIQWLEQFLKSYEGAVIIVSHDRKFLDNITNRTIEISLGKIYDYKLPFSQFIEQREEIRMQQTAAYKQQQKQIAETERFIERFRSKATLASRVQSRIKQLEKMDRIEIEEEDNTAIKLEFPSAPRSGAVVVETFNLTKSYGGNFVFGNVNFALERGERAAFVGKNGEGKSTLTKIIAGQEDYEGELKIGYNVQTGFFAQHQAELLDGDSTVFEVIDNAATGEMRTQVRNLLGAFLFSGDSVYKKVKVLSGGEKSRLAIARLLLEPVNLLILDEPTNHLDMTAKDVLKNALKKYDGALIIVSHDRDFLDGLTEKTVYFGGGKIEEYPGGIYEFLEKKRLDDLQALEVSEKNNREKKKTESSSANYREQKKKIEREAGRIKKQISNVEKEIQKLEENLAEYEAMFSKPDFFADIENSQKKQAEYEKFQSSLSVKMDKWTELNEQLSEIEQGT